MADIYIYGEIGESYWWDEESITGKTIRDQLAQIPSGTAINLRINSPGGNVGEALAIYNLLSPRSADITTCIDGYCCSAASFVALAGDEVVSPESSIWMMHNPSNFAWGDATALRKEADVLDTHRDAVLGVYADRTGKSREEIIAAMDAETWFTGAEAVEFGLATKLSNDAPAVEQVLPRVLASMMSNPDRRKFKKSGWHFPKNQRPGTIAASANLQTIPPIPSEKPTVTDDLQSKLTEAEKNLESLRAAHNLAVAAKQKAEEEIATMSETLARSRKEAIAGKYFQVRSDFSNAVLLDNTITEDELYQHFAEDPKADLAELAEMSVEDAEADLRARSRVFAKLSKRDPLDRVPDKDKGKFQIALKSKSVDGDPGTPRDADGISEEAKAFMSSRPAPRSY